MGLRHHKTLRAPGLPEFIGLTLALGACVPALLWYQGAVRSVWVRTTGHVTRCEVSASHYNAANDSTKVTVAYRYDVSGTPFSGSWTGYWPETEEQSPNALAPDQLLNLEIPDYPLVVLYDPEDPSASTLHTGGCGRSARLQMVVQLLFCPCGVLYCTRISRVERRIAHLVGHHQTGLLL